jgi:hypothetical protein
VTALTTRSEAVTVPDKPSRQSRWSKMSAMQNPTSQSRRATQSGTIGAARGGRGPAAGAAVAILLTFTGCQPRETRFEIVDYRAGQEPVSYFQIFDECYYDLDVHGNVDVVARRRDETGAESGHATSQVLHMHGIWHAVPGQTPVESTQVNATVSYWIVSAAGGIGFEGAGFVTFREDHRGDTLTGELESSAVQPVRSIGHPPELFQRATVTGRFRAVRDKRRVVRALNQMKRLFGPLPRYDAPPVPL